MENHSEVVGINIRVSNEVASMIDGMVDTGRHTSRADVVRTALIMYLNTSSILDARIIKSIESGAIDDTLENRIRLILSKITSQAR